ncbi:hypothetical protein LTR62_002583 [Meristemomyces frigidus]|uniref:feruloyl esterase n=1 Tax=Meristemomyces frigidus TaxID=1508187 RepID=A0AAN7TFL7_9PEZI|nr:hypothetical protein LTR62_002583 [Meristemomyces frigidus]
MLMLAIALLLTTTPPATARIRTCRARDQPAIDVPNTKIVDLKATEHRDYTNWSPSPIVGTENTITTVEHLALDFCNLTVTYVHPGQDQRINVYILLPFDIWNGRYLALEGGICAAALSNMLVSGAAGGYAVSGTDARLIGSAEEVEMDMASTLWRTASMPEDIAWMRLPNPWASQALEDTANIAQQVIRGFYGEAAKDA